MAAVATATSEVCPRIGKLAGFHDYLEEDNVAFSKLIRKTQDVYEKHGFTMFYPPPVELMCNLTLKGGIGSEIYQIADRKANLTGLGLPFDRTVPFAIHVATHEQEIAFPCKRCDISYSFRGEKPQPGRFNGFIQADIDVIEKVPDPLSDAECISTLLEALQEIGITTYTAYLNHVGVAKELLRSFNINEDKFEEMLHIIDKFDKKTKEEIFDELSKSMPELSPEVFEEIYSTFNYEGTLSEFPAVVRIQESSLDAFENLASIFQLVTTLGIDPNRVKFSPKIVRGLNYYTGVVFETFVDGLAKYGSIVSGGRYDNLVDVFVKRDIGIKGVGGSIGLTRLFDVLKREDLLHLSKKSIADVYVIYRTIAERDAAVTLARNLRAEGVKVDLSVSPTGVKKNLQIVDKKKIPFVLLVMNEDEVLIKNMALSEQVKVESMDEIRQFMQ